MLLLLLGTLLLLLLAEGWISMVEAAFFSIPSLALERLRDDAGRNEKLDEPESMRVSPGRVRQMDRLLGQPARLLGAILVSDMLVSVTFSSLGALAGVMIAHRQGWSEPVVLIVTSILLTLLLLVVGETLPKVLALRNPLRLALSAAPAMSVVFRLLAPVSHVLDRAAGGLLRNARPVPFPTEAELHTMIDIGKERGVIIGSEEDILWNLVELDRRTVSEIMTPRIDMVAVDKSTPVRDVLTRARDSRRSRIPVYDGTVDKIAGMFYVKDHFGLEDLGVPVGSVAREPYLIPEEKKVPALLDEFRKLGVHIAVVIDEFGQTAGLVTLEDVLEAIFGEIRDEYDKTEPQPYIKLDARTWVVDGEIDLKTLNRLFRNAFRGQDFERLAGFIHHRLGHLPEVGEKLKFKGLTFEVKQVSGNAIERVLIRRG